MYVQLVQNLIAYINFEYMPNTFAAKGGVFKKQVPVT